MLKNAEMFSLYCCIPKYFSKPGEKLFCFEECVKTQGSTSGERLYHTPVHTEPTARSLLQQTKQSIKLPAKIKNNK